MTELRDARLRRAMEEAPDAGLQPPARTREAIRAAAHAAVEPAWRRWWPAARPGRGTPWIAAFASLVVATLVVLVWHREEIPGARKEAPSADVQAPTAAAPAPEAPTVVAPAPGAAAAPSASVAPAPVPEATRVSPPPVAAKPERERKADDEERRAEQQAAERRAKEQAVEARAQRERQASAATGAPAPSAPAPVEAPPAIAAAPTPVPLQDLTRPAPAEATRLPTGVPSMRMAPAPAPASPMAQQLRPTAPPGWDAVRIQADARDKRVARADADKLAGLLEQLLQSGQDGNVGASPAQLRMEFTQAGLPAGVLELAAEGWRWRPMGGTTRALRTDAVLTEQVREEALRVVRR
ncbi:hypothetical protein HHL11_04650 [Ramlibacter sp. G-1-2-2]|uniref:Meckel syndrome type 1 protein n=1 Tax=Ramlibacter agri TaxID=2728837 RepID=A0A848H0G2_9BURK|nr:hypothetical protein [Ramlibacter agri]NML43029.1 hypothetical protein [Ramlibacter agri]